MHISALCDKIGLQAAVRDRVLAFADTFDFSAADELTKEFRSFEKMPGALAELRGSLGEDPGNFKILACMLKASADLYEVYREKGIGDGIYFDTMRCYTRFIDETYKMTGEMYFDRWWWTSRQAGGRLFRIGELEYEIKRPGGDTFIGLHIPSDADFSPPAVDDSLRRAGEFVDRFFPELSNAEYRCRSWLLDSRLKDMLNDGSNILSFQDRFEIFDKGEIDTDFIEWVFKTRTAEPADLPENTSLQRNLKKYMLSGGSIRSACGRLKAER